MQCTTHSDVAAVGRCTGCAENFCHACLVEVAGQPYCASCKSMAVTGVPVVESRLEVCKEAKQAMIAALVGILLFGIILGIFAVVLGFQARTKIKHDASLTGSGLASAAIVIGAMVAFLSVVGMVSRVNHH
jgi:hypothetical protein